MLALLAACSQQSSDGSSLEARPGDAIEVTIEEIELSRELEMVVTVGGRQSTYVKVLDAHRLEVRVPLMPSGAAKVEVRHGGRTFAGPTLDVTALEHQSISLFVEAGSAIIVGVDATDEPLPSGVAPTSMARISYDYFSEDGSVFIMTTLPHPLGEDYEVVGGGHAGHADDPGSGAHGMTSPVAYELSVVVPAAQGRSILRVFEAKAGLDLSVPHNMHSRKLLGEFILPLEK